MEPKQNEYIVPSWTTAESMFTCIVQSFLCDNENDIIFILCYSEYKIMNGYYFWKKSLLFVSNLIYWFPLGDLEGRMSPSVLQVEERVMAKKIQ